MRLCVISFFLNFSSMNNTILRDLLRHFKIEIVQQLPVEPLSKGLTIHLIE